WEGRHPHRTTNALDFPGGEHEPSHERLTANVGEIVLSRSAFASGAAGRNQIVRWNDRIVEVVRPEVEGRAAPASRDLAKRFLVGHVDPFVAQKLERTLHASVVHEYGQVAGLDASKIEQPSDGTGRIGPYKLLESHQPA